MKGLCIVSALALLAGCGGTADCTDAGCENDAHVTFTGSRPEGPYDLVVRTDGGTFMARCADPGAPEVLDNDPEIECTASGFTLLGDAATGHSVIVTVVPVEMDPLVDGAEVLLSVVDERHPNGEDCPPTCYSRSGQLVLGST